MMIGSAAPLGGDPPEVMIWTVILLDLGEGQWRPITGWPSTGSEMRRYLMNEE